MLSQGFFQVLGKGPKQFLYLKGTVFYTSVVFQVHKISQLVKIYLKKVIILFKFHKNFHSLSESGDVKK